jgi:hypothetical protein
LKFQLIPVIKKTTIAKVDEETEETKHLLSVDGNVNYYSHSGN